jgi:ribosomal protein S18 acetylase RimI-like enzyme
MLQDPLTQIHPLQSHQWQLHKTVRLAARAEAPYAFSTTLESAQARSDVDWQTLTERYANDPNSVTYFAFREGQPCGMAACVRQGVQAEMFAVWVDPEHRRKGVGRALIEYAKTWAQSRGVSTLKVGVFDDNLGALRLYTAAGFQDLGETNPERSIPGRPGRQLSMELV